MPSGRGTASMNCRRSRMSQGGSWHQASRSSPAPASSRPTPLDRAARLRRAVDDATAGQVVWRELDLDSIAWADPNPIPAHPTGRVAERLVSVVEDDSVLAAAERLDYVALDLDLLFLLCHETPNRLIGGARKAR